MTLKNSKGFTLVEMLVVIAIISVLAAALFPAISNALSSASATALKQKGRGIWVAITSANMEREPLNLTALWPYECSVDSEAGSPANAVAYFNYLLSNGTDTTKSTEDVDLRVVADLTPDTLIANGVTAAKIGDALTKDNIAWGVVRVGDATPSEIPFLISRNFNTVATLTQQATASATPLELDSTVKPFNASRAVWVSRGGGTFDARKKYFTISQLMGLGECKGPDGQDAFEYWKE